jgi:uncharacterized membrane protein required for colicin V production
MVSLNFMFWLFVVLFGIIGAMRGWAKELLVVFSLILALAFNLLLEKYVPVVKAIGTDSDTMFWVRSIIVIVLVFFGYQTINIPRFAGKVAREKLQDILLGFVMGAINGYLVVGTIWLYMHQANYPFGEFITPPVEGTVMGDAALALIPRLAPHMLGEPAIYFAVILSFIFVMVVFI